MTSGGHNFIDFFRESTCQISRAVQTALRQNIVHDQKVWGRVKPPPSRPPNPLPFCPETSPMDGAPFVAKHAVRRASKTPAAPRVIVRRCSALRCAALRCAVLQLVVADRKRGAPRSHSCRLMHPDSSSLISSVHLPPREPAIFRPGVVMGPAKPSVAQL